MQYLQRFQAGSAYASQFWLASFCKAPKAGFSELVPTNQDEMASFDAFWIKMPGLRSK
jgi:hypothetical protein